MERPRARGLTAGEPRRGTGVPVLVVSALAAALCTSACAARGGSQADAIASPSSPASNPATAGTVSPASPASPTTANGRTYGLEGHQPLWPFGSLDEARAWQRSYRSGGHAPWHLSAEDTALAFARYLGLKGIDRVTRREIAGAEARIAVGYRSAEGTGTAAVIHLIRLGDGADAPWEVVGTDDKELSLTAPAYGAKVEDSPVTVSGSITGVDESLRVAVHQRSSASPIGVFCCVPAGGSPGRWSAKVPFQGARDSVLTVVVTTGGHVAEVERFAVSGVRTG